MVDALRGPIGRALLPPLADVWHGLGLALDPRRDPFVALGLVFVGLLAGWWLYVPIHELLHAAGCLATGGSVSRLEIQPLYGGSILAAWIPWVVAGGDYAGRLAGFDANGSDWVYLATDLAPYVLTVFPGVWALRLAARRASPALYGFALPWALAPFLSLSGDAFEIGTLGVTQLPPWSAEPAALRGDDAVLWASTATEGAPWAGFVLALALGALWAWSTYGLGAVVARRLGQPALEAPAASSPSVDRDRETESEPAPKLHETSEIHRGAS